MYSKQVFIGKLTAAIDGQIMVETPVMGGRIMRRVFPSPAAAHSSITKNSTVWTGRAGGWIKM